MEIDYTSPKPSPKKEKATAENVCPVCGEGLIQEHCKVVCRSKICQFRIIYNCAEY